MGIEVRTKVLALLAAGLLVLTFGSYVLLGRVHDADAQRAALHALRQAVRLLAEERAPLSAPPSADALARDRGAVGRALQRMKDRSGDEFAVVLRKAVLDPYAWAAANGGPRSGWDDRPDVVVMETTAFGEGLVDFRGDVASIPDGGLLLEELAENGRSFVRGAFPLRDAAGSNVGALFVRHDFTFVREALDATRHRGLFVVLGLALVVLAAVAAALQRLVFGRLEGLRARLEQAVPAQPPPAFYAVDEIARLELLVGAARLARDADRPPRAPVTS